jgi:hypothetical protein
MRLTFLRKEHNKVWPDGRALNNGFKKEVFMEAASMNRVIRDRREIQ